MDAWTGLGLAEELHGEEAGWGLFCGTWQRAVRDGMVRVCARDAGDHVMR